MAGQPSVDLLLRGGTIVPCDGTGSVLTGDVAIGAGVIVEIGPDLEAQAKRIIDVGGSAVIPGFVNAHTHEVMERGFFEDLPFLTWLEDFALPKDRAYQPRHQRAASLLCQAEMISNGTTAFIDIFRHPDEAAAVAVESGLRATISPQIIDEPLGAGETLETSEAFVSNWNRRHPRVRAWFGPHSLYSVSPATYRRIRELADSFGVGIHTHLAESREEATLILDQSGGRTPAQWLDDLIGLGPDVVAAHCIELDDRDLELVVERGLGIAHCPTSNMKLGHRAARVVELLDKGGRVGLGTDSIMTNNNLDPFEEMRQAGLLAKFSTGDASALSSYTLLELATIGSARVLGLDALVGSIEVGKRADLAVVRLDRPHARPIIYEGGGNVVEQLVWSCVGADVRYTIVDGQVVYDDHRVVTLDVEEVLDLVDREARHLLEQAGVLEYVTRRDEREVL